MARPVEFDETDVVTKAMQLFQQQGYDSTSIRDLLEHTGLSSSSLYAAFGGKEQLYMTALKAHAAQERQLLHDLLTAPAGMLNNIRTVYESLIHMLQQPSSSSPMTLRAAVEQAGSMPEVLAFLSEYIEELTQMVAEILERAHASGQITLRFSATETARFVLFNAYNLGVIARVGQPAGSLKGYASMVLACIEPGTEAAS